MPSDVHEKTPGVYVRAENELPHELDMLWANSRNHQREERSPLVSFIVGFLIGGILTAAVFILIVNRPDVKANDSGLMAPISGDLNSIDPQAAKLGTANGENAATTAAPSATQSGSTTYTVVNGDNLGRIAEKVYGSSSPKYIDKIQRANNMRSANSLQIDQKLIIPPRDY